MPNGWTSPAVFEIVRLALDEDIGSGDITTRACVPAHQNGRGRFIAREPLVLAGPSLLPLIYNLRGGVQDLDIRKRSGDHCHGGETIAEVLGPARTLLECERVALNFMQRLSGVATAARHFARQVEGTNCKVLDTRKTMPGLRVLEKLATEAGGITNHRMGLYDAILIKNNHIAAAGGIRKAIERARSLGLPVAVEARTREELRAALEVAPERLLLDNLSPAEAADWIEEIAGRAEVELSGGITLDNVQEYAELGANFVSSGAITQSARAMDISFRMEMV
ncbi:MAG: carboxylating nicotinate-nucleotide diphosphorylase [Bryobacteraceae bacterium]